MSTVVHNSALRTMRLCEQKFTYEYIDELGGDRSTALDVGTWFHLLMEAQGLRQGVIQGTLIHDLPERLHFGLPTDEDSPSVALADIGHPSDPDFVGDVHHWVVEEVHAYMPEGDDEIDAMPDNLWFLYERYMARWGSTMVNEDVLGVEVQWQRSDEFEAEPPLDGQIDYGGQADRIVRSDGLVFIRDHKTTSSKPTADFRLTDSQLHLYAWGIWPWLKEHGVPLHGIEYDYALTYWPKMRVTKAGNLYSNQKVLDLHAARVLLAQTLEEDGHDHDPSDDRFDSYFEKCVAEGSREFFSRHPMPVNETTIKTLLDEGAELTRRAENIRNGGRPIRNTGRHCDWCAFQQVCVGDLLGNDTTPLKEDLRG